jgi:hypothetical protein
MYFDAAIVPILNLAALREVAKSGDANGQVHAFSTQAGLAPSAGAGFRSGILLSEFRAIGRKH